MLHKTPVKEADAMVKCIGEDGLFSFYARGVGKPKSKNAFSLSELTLGDFLCIPSSNGMLTLKEASGERNFMKTEDFDAIAAENFLCEFSSRIFSEEEGEGASFYPFLLEGLIAIKEGFDPLTVAFLCLCFGLKEAGFGLEVDNCVRCKGKTNIVGISFDDGGFVCVPCLGLGQERVEDPYVLKAYRYGFRVKKEDIRRAVLERSPLKVALAGLEEYYAVSFGYRLPSLHFLIENC